MPAPSPSLPKPQEVNTEPQLAELNRMSDELRGRLEAMIGEQQERVRKFTEASHSLSPLPQPAPLPVSTPPQIAAAPAIPVPPAAPAATATPPPRKKHVPPPLPTRPQRPAPRKTPLPEPVYEQEAPEEEQGESAGSYGWLISLGIFILIIALRNCG